MDGGKDSLECGLFGLPLNNEKIKKHAVYLGLYWPVSQIKNVHKEATFPYLST